MTAAHDEIPKYRKKAIAKKPYVIEWRCKPGSFADELCNWMGFRRYATRERMEQALEFLNAKNDELWEYRERKNS